MREQKNKFFGSKTEKVGILYIEKKLKHRPAWDTTTRTGKKRSFSEGRKYEW